MTDNTELKRAASAAKNWGGEVGEDQWYTAECFKRPHFSLPDAEFIACCEPGTILALIAENERLVTACERAEQVINAESKAAAIAIGRANLLQTERDQLKAENEALKAKTETYCSYGEEGGEHTYYGGKTAIQALTGLVFEVEGLRKDAVCVDDLSALVRQLVHRLRKAAPDNDLPGKALDYLKRKGLQGSPLRSERDDAAELEAQKIYDSWAGHEGFVPWVKGGNSLKQDEARRLARAAMGQGEQS